MAPSLSELARERLAGALHKQGLKAEAEEQYRTVIAGLEASVGKGHERTRAVGTKLSSPPCACGGSPRR